MEIPKLLPARGTLQGGHGGIPAGGGRVHRGPDPPASRVPTRRLLLLRGPQDGGPGRRREEARTASRGPGPSLLAPRPDQPSGGGGDDFFLVLLDPVGGDVGTVGSGPAAGPVLREEAEEGPGLQGGESGANSAGRTALGPRCLSAIPTQAPISAPSPAAAFTGTVTIHNQDLLLRFENGVLTLATPPAHAWEPGAAPAQQPGCLIAPQAGFPHAAQPGDCPELPPDLLLAEQAEPAPAPAPEEEVEGPAAALGPRGPLGSGSGMVLYLCPEAQCGQSFAKKHQLKVHLLTHSSSQGQRPFKCPLGGCGWTFTTSYKLKRHLQSHDKLRPFGCPAEGCGKSFTTVYNLKAHMKGHEQENSFKCEVCEESFPTQAKLSAHQRSHFEPERPYQCAFSGCKKTFITVSALFSHNRAHFREQELFSCSFPGCSKQYDKACRLKIHLRSHTGERPFLCDFDGCGWNFTSMSKLLRHKRKHDDDRRFMCPVEGCGKSFTRAEHLKGHSITHLGTKPFVCPVEGCCARFSARSSLYIHSKKHLQDVDTWKSRCPIDPPQSLDTSLFFGTAATGFQQSPLDMDEVSSVSVGSLGSLGSLAMKNSSPEPQALTPSSKLTVDTDALTPSSTLCENSVSELLTPTKAEWNVHPDSDFFGQEGETQFGFPSVAGNHGSQKETDLITVTGSSFLV
ncbi:hypothetical protein H8957_005910 [Semnopithecus entellus]